MLSQGHMVAPLNCYTGQVGPRFGNAGPLEVWKWCHNIMIEADIHLRPLHTSILDIYKVFELLVCCLKGIWLHPHTVTPAKMAPDLGIQVHLRSGNDATTSCLRHTFPIRGSQAFSITDIHTQIITAFYIGVKLETLQKQPFQSSLHFGKVCHPANNSSSKTLPP